ncbi:hypothetical protein [Tatumella sp. OPLPL6]|uniref:hypothetical protein n=1 Tax=Tatumella sp. OPLPL6 TaxID=1928657 RepID=UPI000C1A4486|nr:hypothetical protein [Tatumella sp. OPLPL6]PIJ43284.1 hypothetical protein BOM24_08935 [Tatumella sp. OPLPL6]
MEQEQQAPSIAAGGPLNNETFKDFIQRLRHDVAGERVYDHCTSNAVFIVKRARPVLPSKVIYDKNHEHHWYSPTEYWDSLSQEERVAVNDASFKSRKEPYQLLPDSEQWDFLAELDYLNVYTYREEWEYVGSHLTYAAAEAFIKRKGHDYPNGLRIFTDSRVWCPEFTTIVDALLAGQLVLNTPDSDNYAALVSLNNVNEQLQRVGIDEGSAQLGVLKLIELANLSKVTKAP